MVLPQSYLMFLRSMSSCYLNSEKLADTNTAHVLLFIWRSHNDPDLPSKALTPLHR